MKSQGAASLRVVDQQQVSRKTTLQGWAETSVWSLVCAMELGLISDSSRDDTVPTNDESPVDPSSRNGEPLAASAVMLLHSSRKPARKVSNAARRRRRRNGGYASAARTSNGNATAKNSTVEKFWKSCKRKFAGAGKRSGRDPDDETRPKTIGELVSGKSRNGSERAGEVCPTSKRQRVESFRSKELHATESAGYSDRRHFDRKSPRIDGLAAHSAKNPIRRSSRLASANLAERNVVPEVTPDMDDFFEDEPGSTREDAFYRCEDEEREDKSRVNVESDWDGACKETETENDRSSRFASTESISDSPTDTLGTPKLEAGPPEFESRTPPMAEEISNESSSSKENDRNESSSRKSRASSNSKAVAARNAAKTEAIRAKILKREDAYHEGRRVTRGLTKIGKDLATGKLIWGSCAGWWPALIIDADHVGMLPEAGRLWVYWIGEARISLLNEKTQIEPFSCNLNARLIQNSNVARTRAIDATMQMLRNTLGYPLTKPYTAWIENNFSDIIESLDEIKFYPYPPRIQQRLDFLKEKNAKVTEKYLLDQKKENQGKKVVEKQKESPQRSDVDVTRLPLKEQHPGVIAWAKIAGHNWWPAMIIDYRDCCMREPNFGCQWIMWYGDYKLSQVHHQLFLRFDKGTVKMQDYISNTKKHVYLVGVLQAAKDYCSRFGVDTKNWSLKDAFDYFSKKQNSETIPDHPKKSESPKIYDKYSAHMVEKLNELKNDANVDNKRADDINQSDDLRAAISGKYALESLCLKCLKLSTGQMEIHPFFEGSLCKECSEDYKPRMFVFGNDAKCFYCTVCAGSGMVIICDREDCPRVYCTACVKHLLCPTSYGRVLEQDPWECFLCINELPEIRVKPRANWKEKIIDMFRTNTNSTAPRLEYNQQERRKIRVLSLFDGLSTGLLVLLKLGLSVDVYYASEIDPDALMVSASHFGDRIIHLGDAREITKEKIREIGPIDLLIGGSPCNDLSLANPARLGLYDPKGTGILFFEYCRIKDLVKTTNKGRYLFWLYENVASMPTEYRLEINRHLGQEPDVIDSADFSPQHRLRLYWHNLPIEPHSLPFQGEQDVQDILTPHCQRYALVKKIRTVTTKVNSLKQGKLALKPILMKDESDSLWITELEEIFGFPRHYTDVKNLSATKRQRLIGKSWSVQTLSAILRSLCPFYQCNTTGPTPSSSLLSL